MERRLLLVFALTFLVIMLFQPVLKKYLPQPPAKPESSQAAPAQKPAQPPMPAGAMNTPPAASSRKNTPALSAPQQASSESETIIENGLYRIVFTNRGARVRSWVLKKYTDDKGNPLELVNNTAAEKYGYPLTLWTYDEGLRNQLNSALYVATSTGTAAPAEITFAYSDGDVAVQKSFKFDHSYVVAVRTSVQVKGAEVMAFPMWPAGFGDETNGPQ
jgi:YidC/Oxa1 family membrane protein insertase